MARISFEAELPRPDETTTTRHAEYRVDANEALRATRARRVTSLTARTEAIERAMSAYGQLPRRPATFAVRAGFVALASPRKSPPSAGGDLYLESEALAQRRRTERGTRPPATQLIGKRSRALPTAVSMLYVAQCEAGERGRFANRHMVAKGNGPGEPSWALLSGRYEPRLRARRERMRRDLTHMGQVGLVELAPTGQGRFEAFKLNREDDADRRYVVPGASEDVLALPPALITNGWHLALEPDELALYLAIWHLCLTVAKRGNEPGTPLTMKRRFQVYGVSSEAYDAIHELEEFGLIIKHDTMPHRRRGKVRPPTQKELNEAAENEQSLAPVPYLLELVPDALERAALNVVPASLRTFELPPRVLSGDEYLETKYAAVPLTPPLKGTARLGAPTTAPTAPTAGAAAGPAGDASASVARDPVTEVDAELGS